MSESGGPCRIRTYDLLIKSLFFQRAETMTYENVDLDKLGLVPVDRMAEILGIEPKRLRGFMFRNKVGDPIGDAEQVYGWSCKTLAERLPNIKGVILP